MYVCVLHEFSAYTDKKEKKIPRTQVMDELQTVVNHHVGVWNYVWVPCKTSQCF